MTRWFDKIQWSDSVRQLVTKLAILEHERPIPYDRRPEELAPLFRKQHGGTLGQAQVGRVKRLSYDDA